MNWIVKILGWMLLGLIVVILGIWLEGVLFPPKTINPPVSNKCCNKPVHHTLVILTKSATTGMVEDLDGVCRARTDLVRWVNTTKLAYTIEFISVADGGHGCPLIQCAPIDVPAFGITPYFAIDTKPGSGGSVYFTYKSTSANPLERSGGPDAPGMTVDD